MAYLTEGEMRRRAAATAAPLRKSAGRIIAETAAAGPDDEFEVFLSHSSNEPEDILLGVCETLHDFGLTVYVDKYSDPQLSPDKVDRATATLLRQRMRASRSLLYVYSRHSRRSRWMPWELGFFDGHNGKVGVLPVTLSQEETFKGEEYVSLYPFVDRELTKDASTTALWINRTRDTYARFDLWVRGEERIRKRD